MMTGLINANPPMVHETLEAAHSCTIQRCSSFSFFDDFGSEWALHDYATSRNICTQHNRYTQQATIRGKNGVVKIKNKKSNNDVKKVYVFSIETNSTSYPSNCFSLPVIANRYVAFYMLHFEEI